MEIQRLKRTINKLQNENVTLKRDKNRPVKPEPEIVPKKLQNTSMRGSMYVPSTQRLIIGPKRRESKDTSLIGDLEPDEDKIKEIESNIFNKISQSVEKIFNINPAESRMTFSIPKLNAGLELDKNLRMQTVYEKENKRRKSIEDRFKEIAEASDEEERETYRFNIRNNQEHRSTTFFFDSDKSSSDQEDMLISPPRIHDMLSQDNLIREKTLKIEIDNLPTESRTNAQLEKASESVDMEENINHEESIEQEQKLIEEINILTKEVEQEESSKDNEDTEHDESEIDSNLISQHFETEATEEDKQQDRELQEKLITREKEVDSLENALLQKQELLNAIIESNKEMKKTIVDTMKQEYLKKIIALQSEIKKLEGQKEKDLKKAKTDASKNTVETEYKQKFKEMEKELNTLKKKDKEQVDQLRTSRKQKERIQSLTEEIEGMRAQKIKLMRQIKEEKENYRKWKDEKTKSLLKMKRDNQKKDQEIFKLKKENNKKSNILRRKVEELQAIQKRQKLDLQKHKKAINQKRQSKKIDPDKIKQWVAENTQKLIRYQDIKEEIEKEEIEKKNTELKIEEEQGNYAIVQTKKEKIEAKRRLIDEADLDQLEDIDSELRGLDLELEAITENINSLDDKLEFINEKISVFNKEVIEINPEGIESLRFEEISNLEEAKVYLGSFFNIFLEMNVYRSMVENKIIDQEDSIDKLKKEIIELNNKIQASEIKFREEIHKLSDKYKKKQDFIKTEIDEFLKFDLISSMNEDELEKMLLDSPRTKKDRSISDLSAKSTKQLRDEIKLRKQALKDVARVQATSKIGLSKLVTTLENKVKEDDKKLEILNHKLAQAAHEKQMFKQKYETLKAQIKTNETEDIKLIKTISLETRGGEREKITKSPFNTSRGKPPTDKSELKSLSQVRKERKKIPPSLSSSTSFK